MQVGQGGVAELSAEFRIAGNLVAVTDPSVSIYNPADVLVITAVPTEVEAGSYTYDYDVAEDAPVGWWEARWSATGPSAEVFSGTEKFEVTDQVVTTVTSTANITLLRSRVGDKFPFGSTDDTKTFFTNDELHTLMAKWDNDLDLAAYEGWLIKAGVYADLHDIEESGSTRKLSQKFKHAYQMVQNHQKIISENSEKLALASARVVGVAFSLKEDLHVIPGTPFSGVSTYVRTYALKRFTAVMG